MYKIGDKIVYPMHGAGVVEAIEEKEVFGAVKSYYVLKMPMADLRIMIPMDAESCKGLRYVTKEISREWFADFFSELTLEDEPNWSKRSQNNMDRLRTGEFDKVAQVVKGLLLRECVKPLSTGEKKMLTLAKQILLSEVMVAIDIPQPQLEKIIRDIIKNR